MKILVIDGQGGGVGRALVEKLRARMPDGEILAVGANAIATSAMLKAGATAAATGENAVCVCARDADVIAGPIGIVLKDAMMGEITGAMAAAVAGWVDTHYQTRPSPWILAGGFFERSRFPDGSERPMLTREAMEAIAKDVCAKHGIEGFNDRLNMLYHVEDIVQELDQ